MKKNEHYNQNSTPQLNIVGKSFPYIQKSVQLCQAAICDNSSPQFTIVDYGCSQGANSIVAIKEILSNLKKKKPCNITNQSAIRAHEVRQEEFQLWKQQAHDDYKLFLEQRSKELKKGGVLLCVGPAYVEGHSNTVLHQNLYNAAVSVLNSEEVLNFNSSTYLRTLEELIDKNTLEQTNFEVIGADITENQQPPFYIDFKQGKITLNEYGIKYTGFVRSWSETSLINALDINRDEENKVKIIEELYKKFEKQIKTIESLKLMESYRTNSHFIILRKI
ncbi:unnamed protein product [Adineta steineri]|uniref:SAM dependent carboxyl methyltransferase n=1 Tax=Adineta steineri TaxID=433720 RepID=A0A813S5D5_9BILA|nr:unnamed protein product [Adineta steineri]